MSSSAFLDSMSDSVTFYYQCWTETIYSQQRLICWRYDDAIPTCEKQREMDRIRGQVSLPIFKLKMVANKSGEYTVHDILRKACGLSQQSHVDIIYQ